MNHVKLFFSALMMLISSVATAQTEGVNFVESKSLYEVLQMGKQQGKLVFVDCYTTWCGPCKMMASREFPKKEAGDYFNAKFVNAKFDMEAGEGPQIAEKYQVSAYPTFLILNADGELVHRVVGADDISRFIAKVDAGLTGKTFGDYQREYAAGQRDEAFMKEYLALLNSNYMKSEGEKVARVFLEGKTAEAIVADSAYYHAFILQYNPTADDPRFQQICTMRETIRQRYGEETLAIITYIWTQEMETCIKEENGDILIDQARLNQIKGTMRWLNMEKDAEECEKQVRQNMASRLLQSASQGNDAQKLLKALKGFEGNLVSDFSSEESIARRMSEEVFYSNSLAALAALAPQDKEVKKYVTQQAEARTKLFEAAKTVTTRQFDYDGKQQTMSEIAISIYQKVKGVLNTKDKGQGSKVKGQGSKEAAPKSVPATRLR